jgi:hypothetical protein
VTQQASLFRDLFGPAALRRLDGEDLLLATHERQNEAVKHLAYWLEFKDDEEFRGPRFGRIGGGSALKLSQIFWGSPSSSEGGISAWWDRSNV